jgi:hypothetical protein
MIGLHQKKMMTASAYKMLIEELVRGEGRLTAKPQYKNVGEFLFPL